MTAVELNLKLDAQTTMERVGGLFASSLASNSPTDTLRWHIIREIFQSSPATPWVIAPLTSAVLVNAAGATLGIVTFTTRHGAEGSGGRVAGQFTALATGTVATVRVLAYTVYSEPGGGTVTVSGTYFVGTYSYIVTHGYVYGLTVSVTGSLSATVSLIPIGTGGLVSSAPSLAYPNILDWIILKLVGSETLCYHLSSVVWYAYADVTLLATTLGRATLSSISGLLTHGELPFQASGSLITIWVSQANTYFGLYYTLFLITVPAVYVTTADRGIFSLVLTIG
ncbi:MAG: hypothetical protein QXD60_02825 [Nanopusillaceae archaeon]